MALTLPFLLHVLALVFLLMAAVKAPEGRVSWGWLGLALYALAGLL